MSHDTPAEGTPKFAPRGLLTALATPFRENLEAVDFEQLEADVRVQLDAGVSGLVPCSTVGEAPTLSHNEHDEVIRRVVEMSAGTVPVIAGTGSNSTQEALRLTRAARVSGASAALVITPYYNRPSQEGLYRHFMKVADDNDIPIILYNSPTRTGTDLDAGTIGRIAAHPNVVGILEAGFDVRRVTRIHDACDLAVLLGEDGVTLPGMALGAQGVISVASNVAPGLLAEMVGHLEANRVPEALTIHRRLDPLFDALLLEPNPAPLKKAMALLDRGNGLVRLPICPPAEATVEALGAALRTARLLS